MKGERIALALIVFYIMACCMPDVATARSTSLTTTIIVRVKAKPKIDLPANDENVDIVKKLAMAQPMTHPNIKEMARDAITRDAITRPQIKDVTQDIKFTGEKVYTIIDRL